MALTADSIWKSFLKMFLCLFGLMLYIPVNSNMVMSGRHLHLWDFTRY